MSRITKKISDRSDRFLRKVDRAKNTALYRAGGYGRTTLRRMFRTRKAISEPGQVPSSHGRIKGLAMFEVDTRKKTVAIGMRATGGLNSDLAAKLNKGGTTNALRQRRHRKTGQKIGPVKRLRQRVRARPIIDPLVKKITPKTKAIFINQLKKV
ncbi:hypothetical protein [Fuerstiella marisgermanici]|uniref:Uncharacterized protein n=1 Tax=Fuerstiella marisgermanici TaxID=1891926 RepID=A0A1P8WB99_9PLAN|nr:hypothetical protein [Fuerstiella marisgermanici]APZ91303.1 hypothetical protein Fuma_00891 [Fuerstiella marisgermanici]